MPKRIPPATPPNSINIKTLRSSAKKCLVCPFAKKSTQTVFGEGDAHPKLMVVGEVPGDVEDRLGEPFVGPAVKYLRNLLNELKIDPKEIYLTNAVKHFKYVRSGKRRLHQKPNSQEIDACRPWLAKEIEALQPTVIIALGGTAAASICDRSVGIQKERTKWLTTPFSNAKVLVSWHPSGILRTPDALAKKEKRDQLKSDLRKAWLAARK